ncbi:MAG: enoyl-CoA hydratase-related protein [Thermoprotei archaeon]
MQHQNILVEKRDRVGVITLNRPAVRNALNTQLMKELLAALESFAGDSEVGALVITGGSKFFSAGADIKEMSEKTLVDAYLEDMGKLWDTVGNYSKPLIAAVNGYAYGGGLELVLACDIVVCSEDAKFGQPEINIGVFPGAGGTQRLPRIVGKYRAMEMILTGRPLSAQEAYMLGLANRVVPAESVLDHALSIAGDIASKSPVAVRLAKEAVKAAFNNTLDSGLLLEHRLFYLAFGSEDKVEGMKAFLEKREPKFKGR